jgi:hypothetical protein
MGGLQHLPFEPSCPQHSVGFAGATPLAMQQVDGPETEHMAFGSQQAPQVFTTTPVGVQHIPLMSAARQHSLGSFGV